MAAVRSAPARSASLISFDLAVDEHAGQDARGLARGALAAHLEGGDVAVAVEVPVGGGGEAHHVGGRVQLAVELEREGVRGTARARAGRRVALRRAAHARVEAEVERAP